MSSPCIRHQRAFTLIEVLVVVAIISMLAAILLPSLKKARDQAKAAACAAQLHQIATAQAQYSQTQKDWLPGSPLTTGYAIATTGTYNSDVHGVAEWHDYATPLRREMYGAKTVPDVDLAAPEVGRGKMYQMATEDPFYCAANAETAVPYPLTAPFPTIRAPSFLTMWPLMLGGTRIHSQASQLFPGNGYIASNPHSVGSSPNWDLVVPAGYMPRVAALKNPSIKVFLADGVRFYGGPTEPIDYNTNAGELKGAFAASPPSTYATGASITNAREYMLAKNVSWRHGGKKRINAVFMDAHAEPLFASTDMQPPPSGDEPHWSGSAVHPKHYYPTGTVVTTSAQLHQTIANGTVLP